MSHLLAAFAILAAAITGVAGFAISRRATSLERRAYELRMALADCSSAEERSAVAAAFEGQLTATVHAAAADHPTAARLMPLLEQRVGRIVFGGVPTGVAVCEAMHHGGPFPATTTPRETSVGTRAIRRFLRPVCYQDVPSALLPADLRDPA